MKQKQLESFLQSLDTFRSPRLDLEQYATSASLAASILATVHAEADLNGALVGDLGCGCGIFALGAAQLGAELAIGFDVDEDALRICRENIDESDLASCTDLVQMDLLQPNSHLENARLDGKFDVIITNPPFGTKNNAGVDLRFVERGLRLLRPGGQLFSLHKTATRAHILRRAKNYASWRDALASARCIAELRWNLDKTYRHQRRETIDIAVDLFQFTKCE